MYFHDTNKSNGAARPVPDPATYLNKNHHHHHYNNNINHYCNDDAAAATAIPPLESLNATANRTSRQPGNTAYIQNSVLNRMNANSGMGYEGAIDSCNTEATLISDYGKPQVNDE